MDELIAIRSLNLALLVISIKSAVELAATFTQILCF